MQKYRLISISVFIIFFGTALLKALQKQNWMEVMLYLALGTLSLWADSRRK